MSDYKKLKVWENKLQGARCEVQVTSKEIKYQERYRLRVAKTVCRSTSHPVCRSGKMQGKDKTKIKSLEIEIKKYKNLPKKIQIINLESILKNVKG
ncbi:unnamed protein product [marine sediment metagenome]|uniref:Uncharacterized protein n=1 Tax=marine sediment metagenome TaxID=412755 RepID=X1UL02_9ZZZZ